MADLIDRQDAIDALAKAMPSLTTPDGSGAFDHDIQITDEAFVDAMQIIQELPSAQPTLYGYNIEHLELIARILQKEDLPPERVVEALTDIGRIVDIVRNEFEETLRKAVEQCMI